MPGQPGKLSAALERMDQRCRSSAEGVELPFHDPEGCQHRDRQEQACERVVRRRRAALNHHDRDGETTEHAVEQVPGGDDEVMPGEGRRLTVRTQGRIAERTEHNRHERPSDQHDRHRLGDDRPVRRDEHDGRCEQAGKQHESQPPLLGANEQDGAGDHVGDQRCCGHHGRGASSEGERGGGRQDARRNGRADDEPADHRGLASGLVESLQPVPEEGGHLSETPTPADGQRQHPSRQRDIER